MLHHTAIASISQTNRILFRNRLSSEQEWNACSVIPGLFPHAAFVCFPA
jgi:hypothetical protein